MDVIDAEVIAALRDDVCRPVIIEAAIRRALEVLSPERQATSRDELAADLRAARHECEQLAIAISRGGPLDALLARLTEREAHCAAIEREMAVSAIARPQISLAALERRLRGKLNDWRGLLTRNVEAGRSVLRTLLIGPLQFTPVHDERRRGYAFEGVIALDRLVAGVVDLPTVMASPNFSQLEPARRVAPRNGRPAAGSVSPPRG